MNQPSSGHEQRILWMRRHGSCCKTMQQARGHDQEQAGRMNAEHDAQAPTMFIEGEQFWALLADGSVLRGYFRELTTDALRYWRLGDDEAVSVSRSQLRHLSDQPL